MRWGISLLQLSLSASIFILAVIFFRSLLIHKLPKMTFMFLWGVALVQLLVPFSVHSQFSVFTAVNYLRRMFSVQEVIPLTESSPYLNGGTVIMPQIRDNLTIPTVPLQTTSPISPIVLAWLIGLTLCALYFIIPHLRCRSNYKMSLPIKSDFISKLQKSNPLWRKVQIRQSDEISTPLTYGIFQPVILLPKNLDYTDENQLELILTHEFIHIKRFDTLKKWLLAAGVCVHWFNPFVWIMYILANRDIELSCDESVIWTFGESMKPAYAMALVRLEEKKSGLSPMISNFSKNPTEERIISIMKTKKISITTMLLAIAITVGIVTVFATSSLDKSEAAQAVESPKAESAPALYQGESTTNLMPIDLTFTKLDVPNLMDKLNTSKYRAVYIDNEMVLRVTNDNSILISKDNGAVWFKYVTNDVNATEFANWLLKNDPIPGYSIKEMQSRLANGAEVKHLVFENGKEMYFVIDRNGVQIELVQPDKIASVLIDGQRMMITSESHSFHISAQMLKSFYDLLVSNNILTKTLAEQDYSDRIKYLKEHHYFTVTQ